MGQDKHLYKGCLVVPRPYKLGVSVKIPPTRDIWSHSMTPCTLTNMGKMRVTVPQCLKNDFRIILDHEQDTMSCFHELVLKKYLWKLTDWMLIKIIFTEEQKRSPRKERLQGKC